MIGDEVEHRLGVRLCLEDVALALKLLLQLLIVLDDAVVNHGHAVVHVRVRIALDGSTMGRPPRVADPGAALEGMVRKPELEVAQLALCPAAIEVAVLDGRNPGRVIAAVLEPAQCIHQIGGNGLGAEDTYNSAHSGAHLESHRPICAKAE